MFCLVSKAFPSEGKTTVCLKYICSLKIMRPGRSLHACPFQPAVSSPSVYPWPGSAEPRVKCRQTVTKLPVAPGQLHKFHTPCLQARTRMLYKEAKGFIQNWQNMQLHETLCSWGTFWLTWETKQNKGLGIYKLLCWHFTGVFGFSSHWLDPNLRCSICHNHLFRKAQHQSLTKGCTSPSFLTGSYNMSKSIFKSQESDYLPATESISITSQMLKQQQ